MINRTGTIFSRSLFTATLLTVSGLGVACSRDLPSAPPDPVPRAPAPTIVSIVPSVGSTTGGASTTITGTGLQRGVEVTFGLTIVEGRFDLRFPDKVFVTTPSHAAGSVDVVVTNPDHQTGRAAAAYTFAPPESFDVNGDWDGGAITGHELFKFTVVNGSVVSMSCWTSGTVTLSPPAPVTHGLFSYSGEDGVAISGTILSPTEAKGFVTVGPCVAADWYASRE